MSCQKYHIPIKSQLYENRYLDHQHLSHPIIEQCAEHDQKKERYAKICIVVEEADETLFWLEIIEEIKMLPKEILADLTAKCLDVLKATSSYKKKLNLGS